MTYYKRDIEPLLAKALKQFPAILITGPRQAGKSTLLKHALPDHLYVTLDDPSVRALAHRDPELFLNTHPAPLVLDEIQYAPHLLPYLKLRIDANRHTYGQYVLTSSQKFQPGTDVLAGRVALLELLPFTWNEIVQIPGRENAAQQTLATTEQMLAGFYPAFDKALWFATYLERDVRNIKAIQDLGRFQTFLNLLATRAGSLLNLSELAKECGITQPTAKDWLSVLEATYTVTLLKPLHTNRGKQSIKSPKLYFVDTGLLCHLLGIDSTNRLLKARERGHIFENMVLVDWMKQLAYHRLKGELYFYRTQRGEEVDLIFKQADTLFAAEVKFSETPTPSMASSLTNFLRDHPEATGALLSLRQNPLPLTNEVTATHWAETISNNERAQ